MVPHQFLLAGACHMDKTWCSDTGGLQSDGTENKDVIPRLWRRQTSFSFDSPTCFSFNKVSLRLTSVLL